MTSLATRCPSCGTVFRVVADQLRVSEGWVRCGRCTGVFDAGADLFDLDAISVAPATTEPASTPPAATPPRRAIAVPEPEPAPARVPQVAGPPAPGATTAMPGAGNPTMRADAGAGTLVARTSDVGGWSDTAASVDPTLRRSADAARGALAVDVAAPPGPARDADRRRLRTTAAIAALGVALTLQALLLWRDELAARWPSAAPALAGICRPLGCAVRPLLRLDRVSVEGSALVQLLQPPPPRPATGASDATPPSPLPSPPGAYRIEIVLRNRDALALATPAMRLSLTDEHGELIARRVLRADEFAGAAPTIAAGAELPLRALLAALDRPVAGYTVELVAPP